MLLVRELFPRMIIVDEGLVVADGPTADLMANTALLEAHGLDREILAQRPAYERLAAEIELAVLGRDADRVSSTESPLEQAGRQRIERSGMTDAARPEQAPRQRHHVMGGRANRFVHQKSA